MQVQASKKVKKVIKDPFHIRLLVFIGCASMPETALDPHNKQVIKKPSNKWELFKSFIYNEFNEEEYIDIYH